MAVQSSLVPPLIASLNEMLCRRLWQMNSNQPLPSSLLLVPRYSSGTKPLRFSEQEARFAFVQILNEMQNDGGQAVYYSVETPTNAKHNFQERTYATPRGLNNSESATADSTTDDQAPKTLRSALTDMSLYKSRGEGELPFCLIEFKAGVAATRAIRKDIDKLGKDTRLGHPTDCGLFYHLLNRANKQTFVKLHEHTAAALRAHVDLLEQGEETSIIFSYCVLNDLRFPERPAWAATRSLALSKIVPDAGHLVSWMIENDPYTGALNAGWNCFCR